METEEQKKQMKKKKEKKKQELDRKCDKTLKIKIIIEHFITIHTLSILFSCTLFKRQIKKLCL